MSIAIVWLTLLHPPITNISPRGKLVVDLWLVPILVKPVVN